MNTIKRIKYGLNLAFGKEEHLALTIKKIDGKLMLDVMARVDSNDTLLLMTPYLQGLVYRSVGMVNNWDVN